MKYEAELKAIMENVFDRKDFYIDENTTAADIEGWDSLSHMALIVAIEKYFGIRFKLQDVLAFKKLGDMDTSIIKLIAEK